MCEVEYTGNDRWNLIQMGSPEQIMRKKAPELVAAAEAERKSAEEKLNAQADKEIARLKELERKQEQKRQEERFQEWKKTYLLNIPDNKKLRQFRFYILPNAIKLYSDNECKTVKQEIAKGELFEVMPTRQRKLDNSYSIHVYQGWKGDSRPDTSSYISGWIKTDEFK